MTVRGQSARLLLLAATAACGDGGKKTAGPPAPAMPKAPAVVTQRLPDMPEGHPDLGGLKVASRGPRRMSVDQIERSLDTIGDLPPGTVKLPADLAVTLGRPDYNRVTEENLEPTPLFMKFMVDFGTIYCTNLSDAEAGRPAGERLMTRFPALDDNLRHMLLRLTGIEGAAADPYLARLRAAHERGARSTARARGGYEAVCLALFTSPEFLLY